MSNDTLAFLNELNPNQILCVKENSSPLLINAGAGSGKTKVVASKVAFLIQNGIRPENILALTFTQRAADEMASRVKEILGTVIDLQISTFHSFCYQFLADNLFETSLNPDFKTMPDIAQLVFFARNYNNFDLEFLTSTGSSALAAEVSRFISRCKDELISLSDLKNYIDREEKEKVQGINAEQINTLKDIFKMFSAYEEYKNQQNMVDFGDMLLLVYNILCSNSKTLERCQQKYQYVIVDEFQDTNFVQLKILHLLTKQHKNICVVGDDDQSIYQFRGAYATNIKDFKGLFPTFREIDLAENYRSSGHILQVANQIIVGNQGRMEKRLRAMNDMGYRVKVVECDNDSTQTIFIAEKIEDMLRREIPPKEIAVLCRSKSSGRPIANELKKRKIPIEFVGNPDYFYKPIIKDLISLLRIIQNPVLSNVEMVRTLERDVFCLKKTDVAKFANLANTKMCSIYEAFDFIEDIDIDRVRFLKTKECIDNLIINKNNLTVTELVYQILISNDFYKHELAFNNAENTHYLNLFYEFVKDFTVLYPDGELADFISYIDIASEFGIEGGDQSQNSVQIMTVHSAKGKEFENVFVLDATERKFPTIYRNDKFELPRALLKGSRSLSAERDLHIQEERRTFYVALTRAKSQLLISYPKRYHNNSTDSFPSRFLTSINYKNNSSIDFQMVEKTNTIPIHCETDHELPVIKELIADIRDNRFLTALHKVLFIAKVRSFNIEPIIGNVIEPDYIKLQNDMTRDPDYSKVENKQMEFSASQFNTYDRCPKIYLYRYIYKIPSKPKPYFDFGSTVHKVIEELSKRIQEEKIVDKEITGEILKKFWKPMAFESKSEERKSLEEISEILERFLEEMQDQGSYIVDLEKNFLMSMDDFSVKGVIDRVDSDGNDFVIIDYKTSKETSGPKQALEDIQLVLYTIAVQELYGKIPKLVGWWFLRQNRKIMVQINHENIEKVRSKMGKIVESIKSGDFHTKPGWICKNCDYRLICDDAKY